MLVVVCFILYNSMALDVTALLTVENSFKNFGNDNDEYKLAYEQSFGFFDDIPEKEWTMLSEITSKHQNHKFMEKPLTHNPGWDKRTAHYRSSAHAWYQNNYEPNFSCRFEQRIGGNGNGDGPKWICDPHRLQRLSAERKAKNPDAPGCIVYSIGSNGDFSFERSFQLEFGKETCKIHTFDFGDYKPVMPKGLNIFYHWWGLSTQVSSNMKSLKETMKILGHDKLDAIDVFKIDCEGCEFKTFQDWLQPDIPNLMQILVEVHNAPVDKVLPFFDSFEDAGYVRFHKEPNIQFAGGDCLEYAFLKLDKAFFNTSVVTKK